MANYAYLIIGGGMTADAAIRGIRELDEKGTVGLISAEEQLPYNRPPLSKGLWKGEQLSDIWRGTDQFEVASHLGRTAVLLDPLAKLVIDNEGDSYGYDQLLLATGGTPRRLHTDGDEGIIYFRKLTDYQRLREQTIESRRVAVIGGGYIGAEVAAALTMNGHQVHMVFPESTLLARLLPSDLGQHMNDYYQSKGVRLHPESSVAQVMQESGGYRITLADEEADSLEVDLVVAGLGLLPNTDLAEAAGLGVNNGISVNHLLRTTNDHIFAAGDVANIYVPVLDRYLRFEHEDNANTMGRHAGRAMAGLLEPYQHLPLFYSDLFDVGFEGVGMVDAKLRTVSEWTEEYEEGIIYYLAGSRVAGVLLWNSWGKVEAARDLIRSRRSLSEEDVIGSLSRPVATASGG